MIDELRSRLKSLGMDEEMASKAITTVADFAKEKAPASFRPMVDDVLAGKSPDLTSLSGLLDGFFRK